MKPLRNVAWVFWLCALSAYAGGNQLKNGGFESGLEGWSGTAAILESEAHSGVHSAGITQSQAQWSSLEQAVFLPQGTARVVLSGWMKTKAVVKGKEDWEKARINLEFHDAQNQLTGGYQASAASVDGDSEWTSYRHEYAVPSGATRLLVQCQLGQCRGQASFDDMDLRLLDASGKELERTALKGPMEGGTWYRMNPPLKGQAGVWVDWSELLDAPAGKHGFLKVVNGHFQYEDGTPARFWGTNLVASNVFCSHEQAEHLADRLSKMGVNLLRLHHMDAAWAKPNVFGNADATRKLDTTQLEKVDYLVSELKKRGIYLYLDFLVSREFLPGDGVNDPPPEPGGKQVGFFAPQLIELQKEYARQWMEHVNPYTGLAYKDEPAIVGSEFINESTPFVHFGGDITGDGPYRKMLEELWKDSPYGDEKLGCFTQDWEHQGRLKVVDGVGDGNSMLKFFYTIQTKYLSGMTRALRQAGCRYPLAGSNFPIHILADEAALSNMDAILYNGYWDHPQVWKIQNDWANLSKAPIDNQPQLGNMAGSLIPHFAQAKLAGKPFLITEWNDCFPNEYRLEGAPFLAAYADLQGWDGALQFDFDHGTPSVDSLRPFELSTSPDALAQWVAAAPLFHRRDIREAPGEVVEHVSEEKALSMPSYSDFIDRHPWLPFVTKVSRKITDSKADTDDGWAAYQKNFDVQAQAVTSETGELVFGSKDRFLRISAPRVQGGMGAWKGRKEDFPAFTVELKNDWASVYMVSRQAVPLDAAATVYLVVVTPVKMTGQTYQEDRCALQTVGHAPLLAQTAEGKVLLKRMPEPDRVTVRPMNLGGMPGKPIPLKPVPGGLSLALESGHTFVYEITYR
jgi:hypothetical protein